HGSFRHGDRYVRQQPLVERLRDQVVRAESQRLALVHARDFVARFQERQVGDGMDAGYLHFVVYRGGADVQRATEQERETEYVVHLVRVIRPARGHDRVRASFAGNFRQYLRRRICQSQNERPVRHGSHHVRAEHVRCRKAEKDVRPLDRLAQGAQFRRAGVPGLVWIHILRAPFVNDPLQVHQRDIGRRQADAHQQVEAGEARRAAAGRYQFHVLDGLVHQAQAVPDRGRGHDSGTVLVIMEYRDVHAFAQLTFYLEAFWRLDVLQVDSAESRLEPRDHFDEHIRIGLIYLQVKDVDAGEAFEDDGFAFHHGLGSQRADITQPQHGGTVGDHRHQVAARRVQRGFVRPGFDTQARVRNSGRIRLREVELVRQRLGRCNFEFARRRQAVITEGALLEGICHLASLPYRRRNSSAQSCVKKHHYGEAAKH